MEFEPTKEDLQQLRQWIQKTPYILQNYGKNCQFIYLFIFFQINRANVNATFFFQRTNFLQL